ncbi:hypothetical protein AKG38_18420 [Pectobacterium carotovorum subsp. carotovorum]|nr:hypothetical protein [Pectobacterium carotovorum subsp. carotovorum]
MLLSQATLRRHQPLNSTIWCDSCFGKHMFLRQSVECSPWITLFPHKKYHIRCWKMFWRS